MLKVIKCRQERDRPVKKGSKVSIKWPKWPFDMALEKILVLPNILISLYRPLSKGLVFERRNDFSKNILH